MTTRSRRLLTISAVAAVLLLAALASFVWWGPIPVSDKRVMLDFLLGRGITPPSEETVAERLQAPPGLHVQAYSSEVPLARVMVFTPGGDLIVSRTRGDLVSLLERDRDGDGRADGHRVLFDDLDGPHGLALHEGWVYVAERTAIGRARFDGATGQVTGRYERILTGLTSDGFHQTKTIGFGPDGWLYLAQGSSCNVCIEKDPRRATVMRMRPDGSEAEVIATGLRNSVGFDWAPWDGGLYATDNGRDLLGDDFPPDELNRIEPGRFYGWPYEHGNGVPDPEFGGRYAGDTAPTDPVHGFRPHNAPLGIHFLREARLPAGYERTALVALHGSWNRKTPDGYKVVALRWREDGTIEESEFLTGFLGPDGIIGRPAFLAEGPDGAIYVSDDYAGVIYRVSAAR
jgi:glucose/arabinose dehydrogenase